MLLENICLQGSHILEVKEAANGQLVDILLDSPSDAESDLLEKKVLRLKEVILYTKREVPFSGNPIVRCVKILRSPEQTYTAFAGPVMANYKMEIITNAGSRVLEFADWSWYNMPVQEVRQEKIEVLSDFV